MYEVSTSILNAEKGKEAEIILALEKARTDYIHIDVMDGEFVEKNTYQKMLELSSYVRRISNMPLDVHLMVKDVETAINVFTPVEANLITFHLEACKDEEEVFKFINMIKDNHSRVGIAVKPETKIEEIYKFLPYIHVALVMTVEPGKGGQTLISDMVNKVQTLKDYINENNLDTVIEVDGGINLATCEKVKKAGANMLVAGTAILMAKNYKDIIDDLKEI
jgi:ribulose-phosphate 3-epimerase